MPKGVLPESAQKLTDGLSQRERRYRPALIVNTGLGKGKSTSAFGVALRAWNQGWNTAVFQFVKSAKWKVGEQTALEALGKLHQDTGIGGAVSWFKMGTGWSWARKSASIAESADLALAGWEEVKRRLSIAAHDLYILDEFTYPINWGWIDITDVVDTLSNRPGTQHLIITGREAHPKLIEIATTVTEMTKIKHPFDQGQRGQKGIEW